MTSRSDPSATPTDRIAYLRSLADYADMMNAKLPEMQSALTEALDLLQAAERDRDRALAELEALRERIRATVGVI